MIIEVTKTITLGSHTMRLSSIAIDVEYFVGKKSQFFKKKNHILRGKIIHIKLIYINYVKFKLNSNIFINVVAFMIGIIPIKRRNQPDAFLKSIHTNHWTIPPFSQCTRMEKIKTILNTSFPASKAFLNGLKKWGMEGGIKC